MRFFIPLLLLLAALTRGNGPDGTLNSCDFPSCNGGWIFNPPGGWVPCLCNPNKLGSL